MSKHKRMRLPNGFGQISEIKTGRLRKPFRAMVTVGKSEFGRPIVKPLKPESYFKTYNEAYSALMKYHENPYDYDSNVTLKEVYERWFNRKYNAASSTMSIHSRRQTERVWKYCQSIENITIQEIRVKHIRYCMDNGIAVIGGVEKTPDPMTKRQIKQLLNMLFDYAIEYGLVEVNYARNLKLPKELIQETNSVDKEHIPYTDEEMEAFWGNVGNIIADFVLIQCYSGWRPQELLDLKLENITDLSFTGGLKTSAGKNRTVPIHSKIKEIVGRIRTEAKRSGSEYLFFRSDKSGNTHAITYRWLLRHYDDFLAKHQISSEHRPHDGRKHFITQAKKYNVDEYAIKKMVGHEITDLTERVYTQRDLDWYIAEIEKIK